MQALSQTGNLRMGIDEPEGMTPGFSHQEAAVICSKIDGRIERTR
jgi:hypothetical protein